MALKRGPRRTIKKTTHVLKEHDKPISLDIADGPTFRQYSARDSAESRRNGLYGYIGSPDGVNEPVRLKGRLNSADRILEITRELQENGINTAKITHRNQEQLTYENAGQSIKERLLNLANVESPSVKRMRFLLSAAARQLGEMHALGYSHGHPHPANFVVKGSKVSIIDLKYAKKKKINWKDPESVFEELKEDYGAGLKVLHDKLILLDLPLKGKVQYDSAREFHRFLVKMIQRYPTDERVKREVFRLILVRIIGRSDRRIMQHWNKAIGKRDSN